IGDVQSLDDGAHRVLRAPESQQATERHDEAGVRLQGVGDRFLQEVRGVGREIVLHPPQDRLGGVLHVTIHRPGNRAGGGRDEDQQRGEGKEDVVGNLLRETGEVFFFQGTQDLLANRLRFSVRHEGSFHRGSIVVLAYGYARWIPPPASVLGSYAVRKGAAHVAGTKPNRVEDRRAHPDRGYGRRAAPHGN